jgi:hypothetical protein
LAGYFVVYFATLGEASHQLRLRQTLTCHRSPLVLTIDSKCGTAGKGWSPQTSSIEN